MNNNEKEELNNLGTRNEYLLKIYLVYLRDYKPDQNTPFGKILSVGFNEEYQILDFEINFDELFQSCDSGDYEDLSEIIKKLNLSKAPARSKADVFVNSEGVSTKSMATDVPDWLASSVLESIS